MLQVLHKKGLLCITIVSGIFTHKYSAKIVLYRLASTDSPGMSRVSGESVDTLPRGYCIGWHPWTIRGCSEYSVNPWILCQGGII